jgi:hypothetical protein
LIFLDSGVNSSMNFDDSNYVKCMVNNFYNAFRRSGISDFSGCSFKCLESRHKVSL